MPRKLSTVLDDARGRLQDRDIPYRYSEDDLVDYLNDGFQELRRLRPDAFFGLAALPIYVSADLATTDFPVDEQFDTAIVYYIVGNAELRDDEFVIDGRVAGLLKQFVDKLTTVRA
jgi:hypothetical protein